MTATIETIITCDGASPACQGNAYADSDLRHLSAEQQRAGYTKNADAAGMWVFHNDKDYCPACWTAARQRR